MTTQTSQPSSFDPCHSIKLVYPAFNKKVAELEYFQDWYFIEPYNVQQHYYPCPPLTIAGQSLPPGTPEDHPFFSIFPTTRTASRTTKDVNFKEVKLSEIIEDIRDAAEYVGDTQLCVDTVATRIYWTYTTKKATVSTRLNLLCIQRTTRFASEAGTGREPREEQVCLMVPFDENTLLLSACSDQWYLDLIELVYKSTDRAVRHFDAQVDSQDEERLKAHHSSEVWNWLPERLPQYEVAVDQMPWEVCDSRHALLNMPNKCIVCEEDCDPGRARPFYKVDCNSIYCRTCILRTCNSQRLPANVPCPNHIHQLFTRPLILEFLSHGSMGKWYIVDKRYNSWENWERSCLDLDQSGDGYDDFGMTVNSKVLIDVWHKVLQKAGEEPLESCSSYHRVDQWAEFHEAQTAILKTISRRNGNSKTLSTFRQELTSAVEIALRERVLKGPLFLHLSSNERKSVHNRSFESIFRRPGLYRFIEKMIERTLMFWIVRACDCKEAQASNNVYHHHGIRPYYYPENLKKLDLDGFPSTPVEEATEWDFEIRPDDANALTGRGQKSDHLTISKGSGSNEVQKVSDQPITETAPLRDVVSDCDVSGPRTSERVVNSDQANQQEPKDRTLTPPAAQETEVGTGIDDNADLPDPTATNNDSSQAAPDDKKSVSDNGEESGSQGYVSATPQFIAHHLFKILTREPQRSVILRTRLETFHHVTIEEDAWVAATIVLEQDRRAIVENESDAETIRTPDMHVEHPAQENDQPPQLSDERLDGGRRGEVSRYVVGHDYAAAFGGRARSEMVQHVADRTALLGLDERSEDEASYKTADDDDFSQRCGVEPSSPVPLHDSDQEASSEPDHLGKGKAAESKAGSGNMPPGMGSKATHDRNARRDRKKKRQRAEVTGSSVAAQTQGQPGQTQAGAVNSQATQAPPAPATRGLIHRMWERLLLWRK